MKPAAFREHHDLERVLEEASVPFAFNLPALVHVQEGSALNEGELIGPPEAIEALAGRLTHRV